MEKYMNMPILRGHISDEEFIMIYNRATQGCHDAFLLYRKYRIEMQFEDETSNKEIVIVEKKAKVSFLRKILNVIKK